MLKRKIQLLEEVFGDFEQQGSEYLFYCPKCDFHKKKLSFNVLKDKFKCWYCDWSGNSIAWAIRYTRDKGKIFEWEEINGVFDHSEFDFDKIFNEGEEQKPIVESLKYFKTLNCKEHNPSSIQALKYLKQRGVSEKDIVYWKMGYCDEGRYNGRIIIPSFDLNGDMNYFIARTYKGSKILYLNPIASKNIVFNELYIDYDRPITLVEGVFDAIVASNSIPLLGSTLIDSSYILECLIVNECKSVYLALDTDVKLEKENKIINVLLKHNLKVLKVPIKPYKDVGEMTKGEFEKRKKEASEITFENQFERMLMDI
jgi:DNA primase